MGGGGGGGGGTSRTRVAARDGKTAERSRRSHALRVRAAGPRGARLMLPTVSGHRGGTLAREAQARWAGKTEPPVAAPPAARPSVCYQNAIKTLPDGHRNAVKHTSKEMALGHISLVHTKQVVNQPFRSYQNFDRAFDTQALGLSNTTV